ncbi:MAG: CpsD/CapB family tyrosine-protein kinase [Lachnospiraceae bacterium]|nr:CpsD/CapB family tyrosine-protein kinase [Lachnospiraceae bacterium]
MQKVVFEKLDQFDYRINESFKTIRTNIQFSGKDTKTILFTSCTPNEGKSSVTFNLARSFAENGKKVILIDGDLRKSVLIGRYKAGSVEAGLSNHLSGQHDLDEVICETNIPNMDIIFAGKVPPNPAELLGSDTFKEMIAKLREIYDYILIDSPPLGSVIDSAVIATVADGAVLIIENNAISYRFVQDVKGQIEKSGCKIIGAVLNKVEMKKHGKYGKYYGKYYGNYGK